MAGMPVVRTYRCPECSHTVTVFHQSREEAAPDCPKCAVGQNWVPQSIAIKTNASKAGDHVYRELERTTGITDMKDNLREGDTAEKTPPQTPFSPRWADPAEMFPTALAAGRGDPNRKNLDNIIFRGRK